MRPTHESIVERLAAKALRRGADSLDIEYKGGWLALLAPGRWAWTFDAHERGGAIARIRD